MDTQIQQLAKIQLILNQEQADVQDVWIHQPRSVKPQLEMMY